MEWSHVQCRQGRYEALLCSEFRAQKLNVLKLNVLTLNLFKLNVLKLNVLKLNVLKLNVRNLQYGVESRAGQAGPIWSSIVLRELSHPLSIICVIRFVQNVLFVISHIQSHQYYIHDIVTSVYSHCTPDFKYRSHMVKSMIPNVLSQCVRVSQCAYSNLAIPQILHIRIFIDKFSI